MRHEEWMERMLQADPADLAGEGGTPLAVHVRQCRRCRSLGRRLLDEQAALAGALESVGPKSTAAEAADRVLEEERSSPIRFRWAAVLAPLAAAAVVTALLLWTPRDGSVRRAGSPTATDRGSARVSVEVPEGGALVFATRDPTVTLVWIERPEGERR